MKNIYLPGTDIKYNNVMMGNAFALYDIMSKTDPLLMQGRDKYKIASKIAEFISDDLFFTLCNKYAGSGSGFYDFV